MSESDIDLSGHWTGFYNYPDQGHPVSFEAELRESSGCVTGTITEIADTIDTVGQTLHAVIDGRRELNSVRFLKMYDETKAGYDIVRYDGTLDAEGNEIEGRWQIPGTWSGTFLMIRNIGATETIARTVEEPVQIIS
jgi:hypothetical protein